MLVVLMITNKKVAVAVALGKLGLLEYITVMVVRAVMVQSLQSLDLPFTMLVVEAALLAIYLAE